MKALLRTLSMIFAILKKELIVIVMDPGSRRVLVVPIIVQCIIFGYGANFQLEQVPYAAFSASDDALSRQVLEEVANTPGFVRTRDCLSLECAAQSVESGEALIGIYFAPDFKRTREVLVMADGRQNPSANTALSYVQAAITKLNVARSGQGAVSLDVRQAFNENNITRFTVLTGMVLALTVVQVVMLSSLEVSREREEGSFDMMLMTPASSAEMLIGKALPPVIVAVFQSLTLAAICNFYFDIPFRGSVWDLLAVILLFGVACVGIGLAVSVLSKTSLKSIIVSFLIVMPAILMSGLITPVDAMPQWFRYVAYCDPLYYGIEAVWRVYLQGETFVQNLTLLLPLFGIAAVTLGAAGILFRKNLD
ncbi:MAG: ABC transporter permease [Succinivibrio sp.]|nr:ABC transporter permease [Succinivibrio sp.]